TGEPTFTTATDGTFKFIGLAAGTYRIRDVLPTGWRRTLPTAGDYDVTVAAGQTVTGKDFAETTRAVISGTIFNDTNGNALKDSTEAAVSGRVVFLDTNKNGKLDTGELSFTTGADGKYSFVIPAGTYRVRDVLPAGWRRTLPSAGYYDATVTSGQAIASKNFAETTRGLISGVVFNDTNGNAVKDSTEVALSGWVVFLDTNNNGKLDSGELSVTTGADGKFSFVVPAGTYHLREVLKSGFTRTTPSTGVFTLTLGSGQVITGKNFGDR
ncbi:MAG TPA: SdrD B-like domain-containing protein, partial [Humisphaera sp.]|nr:SdrD B-like domain-containing protein [Humisphaera sp.]